MFVLERTKELDRQIKAAGIKPRHFDRLSDRTSTELNNRKKKNTFFRNMLACMIRYERFRTNPNNAEIIAIMKLNNNNLIF